MNETTIKRSVDEKIYLLNIINDTGIRAISTHLKELVEIISDVQPEQINDVILTYISNNLEVTIKQLTKVKEQIHSLRDNRIIAKEPMYAGFTAELRDPK